MGEMIRWPADRNGIVLKPGTKVAVYDMNRIAVGEITHFTSNSICIRIGESTKANRFLSRYGYVSKIIALPDDFLLDKKWNTYKEGENLEDGS
jgi:hypothetical protein